LRCALPQTRHAFRGLGRARSLTIGLFLYRWNVVSDRINKGPAYAPGLFVACIAVIAAFFLLHGATPLVYLVAFVAGVGFSGH
jgi:Na+/melibiose symporter-like transporter